MDVFFPRPPRICGARNGPTLRTDKNEENYIVQHGVTDFCSVSYFICYSSILKRADIKGKILKYLFLTVQHFLHEPLALAGPTPILISIDFSSPTTHSTS